MTLMGVRCDWCATIIESESDIYCGVCMGKALDKIGQLRTTILSAQLCFAAKENELRRIKKQLEEGSE